MNELTEQEKKLIEYALCYLNANVDDKAEEDLDMLNPEISQSVLGIQKKLFPSKYE